MIRNQRLRILVVVLVCALPAVGMTLGQVTSATLYGTAVDETGAVIPGADVTLTNEDTGVVRDKVTNTEGHFTFDFLPVGTYTLEVALQGFKTSVTTGLEFEAGQQIRREFVLQVGQLNETVTVQGGAQLVNTTNAEQRESISDFEVKELPLSHRNFTNVLMLSAGVDVSSTSDTRSLRINGVGKHGTGISVDGTDANANPEGRGISDYHGRNYIDVMSIDAIQEVQVMRGILAAEYGNVVGGQVNLISKSGTNQFHGSAFYNYQSHIFNARDPFRPSKDASGNEIPQDRLVFNQFGGSLGGPVIKNRAFFFATYEGYRESQAARVSETVPTAALRQQLLDANSSPALGVLLDTLPLPNVPRDQYVGQFEGAGSRSARENHFVTKGDLQISDSSNLSVTYTRRRPRFTLPSANINGSNDRTYFNQSDRITAQYVMASATWTSETRFGFNRASQQRLDEFFLAQDPNQSESITWGRRIPRLAIQGDGFGTVNSAEVWDMDGDTYSFDQKIAHTMGNHSIKFGGDYQRITGFRSNPENPNIIFPNIATFLSGQPSAVIPTFGSPLYTSHMDSFGVFVQDDWRASRNLTVNAGIRYDYYGHVVAKPVEEVAAYIVNYEPPTDWHEFNFGPLRPFDNPYESDAVNFGPRLGFAYNPDGQGRTVIRGGAGVLFSPQIPGTVRQSAGNPTVPARVSFSATEVERYDLAWPAYNEDLVGLADQLTAESGKRFIFSILNTQLENPYTINFQLNIERELAQDLMMEVGYVGVRGVKFIMHRRYDQPDRLTGVRPNPDIIPGGYWVDNSESTIYNALQVSLRKRFTSSFSFDGFYTWSKGLAYAGGDIGAYYQGEATDQIQDFFNVGIARGLVAGDTTHRFAGDIIYELPRLEGWSNPIARGVLGGWNVSTILQLHTGTPVIIVQDCPGGDYHCRPDYVGGAVVNNNWISNENVEFCNPGAHCPKNYVVKDAFTPVPLDPESDVAIRPGTAGKSLVRGPGFFSADFSLAKYFTVREGMQLQARLDMFNALNHVNFNNPNNNVNSVNFGLINGAGNMRTMQVGLHLTF